MDQSPRADGLQKLPGDGVQIEPVLRLCGAQAAGLEIFLPPPVLCTDNAAMVAALGYRLLMAGQRLDLTGDVFSRG